MNDFLHSVKCAKSVVIFKKNVLSTFNFLLGLSLPHSICSLLYVIVGFLERARSALLRCRSQNLRFLYLFFYKKKTETIDDRFIYFSPIILSFSSSSLHLPLSHPNLLQSPSLRQQPLNFTELRFINILLFPILAVPQS